MLTVKVSLPFDWPLERQTPGGDGIWGNCRFLINQDVEECDFWVVVEGLKKQEKVCCHHQNTLFITCEPPEVKNYNRNFLNQFSSVITCNRNLPHSNPIFTRQGLPWMIGAELEISTLAWKKFMSFEELAQPVAEKSKLLSVVLSRKDMTPGHAKRARFIDALVDALGDAIDVFGIGYTPLPDKWDAIVPYRYHLAIENSQVPDYWTEKLSDAFIGEALPIYSGCPNVYDYFPKGSLELININNYFESIEKIKGIINSNLYHENRRSVIKAKQLTMYNHNVFEIIENHVKTNLVYVKKQDKQELLITPEKSWSTATMSQQGKTGMNILRRMANFLLGRQPTSNHSLSGVICSGSGDNLIIGDNVSFGGNVFLFGTETIEIGDHTMIAYGTIIHTSTHNYLKHPMWSERIDRPVKIGRHVWIGAAAIIMPGITIGDYAVIGAGAVVSAHVPDGAIVVGIPARIVKYRNIESFAGKEPMPDQWGKSAVVKAGFLEEDKKCRDEAKNI